MTESPPHDDLKAYLERVTIGAVEPRPIVLLEYDPAWAVRFSREAAAIRAALGERCLRLEHIGSTAVPGLAAKPVVDILLVVEDPADEASYLAALEAAGYELRIREPDWHDHRMLRTPAKDVHLHVFGPASPEIERYFLLRDRLREDPAERELYAATKRRLAARDWPTMDHYAQAKGEVIEAIVARARAARAAEDDARSARGGAGADRPARRRLTRVSQCGTAASRSGRARSACTSRGRARASPGRARPPRRPSPSVRGA